MKIKFTEYWNRLKFVVFDTIQSVYIEIAKFVISRAEKYNDMNEIVIAKLEDMENGNV